MEICLALFVLAMLSLVLCAADAIRDWFEW
jgi:hypothetical protein